MTLMNCNEEMRVGDYVSDYEHIAGFVGLDAESEIVTETCEMFGDAKSQPFVVEVKAVVKENN